MTNFWDSNVWGFILLMCLLLGSLLVANVLKRQIKFLKNSLIPNSVLGGIIILTVEWSYKLISGNDFFASGMFGANGNDTLEVITYHCLALGFIAFSIGNEFVLDDLKKPVNKLLLLALFKL